MDYTSKKHPPHWRVVNFGQGRHGLNPEWYARPQDFEQLVRLGQRLHEIQVKLPGLVITNTHDDDGTNIVQIYFLVTS